MQRENAKANSPKRRPYRTIKPVKTGLNRRDPNFVEKLVQIVRTGSEGELLGVLSFVREALEYSPRPMELVGALYERSKPLEETSQTEWSNLLDEWFSANWATLDSQEKVRQGWREWAETLTDKETFEEDIEPIWNFKCDIPLQAVFEVAPALDKKTFDRAVDTLYTYQTEWLWERIKHRTELDGSLATKYLIKEMKEWKKEDLVNPRWTTDEWKAAGHWHTPIVGAFLLEEWAKLYKKESRTIDEADEIGRKKGAWWELVTNWQGSEEKFWRRVIKTNESYAALESIAQNPNVPLSVCQEILVKYPSQAVRQGLARNKWVVKDKKTRRLLTEATWDTEVWAELLATSLDAKEASLLLSYIAIRRPETLGKIGVDMIPAGTVIAKGLLARIMNSEMDKDARVRLIAILPNLQPVDLPEPELPRFKKPKIVNISF